MAPSIELFTANTPNGVKIPIALEELGVAYDMKVIRLGSASLRAPEYLAINPNAKLPAMRHCLASGESVSLFESGAILLHLAEHYGALMGETAQGRADTLSWLFLQVAGLGPAMGQAGHFLSMKSPDPYALGRFEGEARRHFDLLEWRLSEGKWLNRETYSIADIAHFSWARKASYCGLKLSEFPVIEEWVARIDQRSATQRELRS